MSTTRNRAGYSVAQAHVGTSSTDRDVHMIVSSTQRYRIDSIIVHIAHITVDYRATPLVQFVSYVQQQDRRTNPLSFEIHVQPPILSLRRPQF